MKKIFFAFFNKVSNSSNVNEIVRCTMKSSLGSDEAKHYWFKRVFDAYHSRRRIHFSYIDMCFIKKHICECKCVFSGRGYRNRTYTKGVRVPCATTTPIPTDESIIIQRHKKHKFSTQTANMKNYCNVTLIVLKYKKILYIIWQKPLRIA